MAASGSAVRWQHQVMAGILDTPAFMTSAAKAARTCRPAQGRGHRGEKFQAIVARELVDGELSSQVTAELNAAGIIVDEITISRGPEDFTVTARRGRWKFTAPANLKWLGTTSGHFDLCSRARLVEVLFGEGDTDEVVYAALAGQRPLTGEYWVWIVGTDGTSRAIPISFGKLGSRGAGIVKVHSTRPGNMLLNTCAEMGTEHDAKLLAKLMLDDKPRGLRGYVVRRLIDSGVEPEQAVAATANVDAEAIAQDLLAKLLD